MTRSAPCAPAVRGLAGCVLALAAGAAPAAQEGDARPQGAGTPAALESAERVLQLTLQDAIRIALEQNLGLEVEQLATESSLETALGSWGAFDPVIFVQGELSDSEIQGSSALSGAPVLQENSQDLVSRLTVPVTTGATVDLSYTRRNVETNNQFAAFDVSTTDVVSASLTQPLLKGAWKRYATTAQRESEIAFKRQVEREKEVRQRLVLDVYNAYWDLVSALEELQVREFAVTLGQQQLDQDQRRLDVGAGTEVDVLQSRTNIATQEQDRIRAQSALRGAEDNLRSLLFQKPKDIEAFLEGWDWPVEPLTELPGAAAEERDDVQLDWRASLREAIDTRPELTQQRLDIDAAEVRLERAHSDRLPQLDLAVSATGVGFDPDPNEALHAALSYDFPEYRGGVTFSMPLFNRTARSAVRSARALLRGARLAYDQRELQILAEVRNAVREVHFQSQSITAAQTSLELARRQLEAEKSRQQIGLSTTFQVLILQQDLVEAQSAERAARAAYAKALAQLGFAEGSLAVDPPFPEREPDE